ncbi:MAG: hypothetical protein K6U80_04565 [Firmicutes bacterium]|nr:hypothetical protein [Bacillota bacterium]
MKIRRLGMSFFAVILLAVGMAGCSDFWTLDLDNPVQITASSTFVVKADGEDPLDARTWVEQILAKRGCRVISGGGVSADTFHLIISYEYLPENENCRYFTFILRDAAGRDLKTGTYNGEKPLKDLLFDFDNFLFNSLFKKQ